MPVLLQQMNDISFECKVAKAYMVTQHPGVVLDIPTGVLHAVYTSSRLVCEDSYGSCKYAIDSPPTSDYQGYFQDRAFNKQVTDVLNIQNKDLKSWSVVPDDCLAVDEWILQGIHAWSRQTPI